MREPGVGQRDRIIDAMAARIAALDARLRELEGRDDRTAPPPAWTDITGKPPLAPAPVPWNAANISFPSYPADKVVGFVPV
jgi:hypothetical protein